MDRREPCPRRALKAIVEASPYSFAELSRMLGRPNPYLAAFVRIGKPAALTEAEHRQLADFFGLDERALGVRELWRPIAA
ncbi:MAG: hypothetical protein PGN16_00050 [Sphingomonas phyllosphaerae]|uniref:hypothetical protein n=1 Tax=Sphingomonas phyllosphaerae TaxID=257003 RepID=UPI002FFA2A6B